MHLAVLLLTLTLLAQGTSIHVVNGTVVHLPGGPVVIAYPVGQKVATFNATQGKWTFRIYEEGPIVITLASSNVSVGLRKVWYAPFEGGYVASVEVCVNATQAPNLTGLWEGMSGVQGVPGLSVLITSSPAPCGEDLLIQGNNTMFSYLTYFNQYSWTAFELSGGNWTLAVILGEVSNQTTATTLPPLTISTQQHRLTVGPDVGKYVPLIISAAALALAAVAERANRGGH
ncbi:MAG: hypothetical protein GU345_03490 [Acidilobus sp.]|nr:hypothetical protein [Acidilobus sp.]